MDRIDAKLVLARQPFLPPHARIRLEHGDVVQHHTAGPLLVVPADVDPSGLSLDDHGNAVELLVSGMEDRAAHVARSGVQCCSKAVNRSAAIA